MLQSDNCLPSKNPMDTVVDLYDRTMFLLADGIDRNEDTAIIAQRATIKKNLPNITRTKL